jgi:hypothetical protein
VNVLERRRPSPTRKTRGRAFLRAVLVIVCAVLVFLLGIAFARTLDERPRQGDPVTTVRTLTPLPQLPPSSTVTVTVTVR